MNIGIVTPWFERGAGNVSVQYIDLLKSKNNIFVYARGGAHFEKEDNKWSKENVTYGLRVPSYSRDQIHPPHFAKWIKSNSIEIIFFNEQISFDIILWMKTNMPEIRIGAYIDYYTEDTLPLFALYDFLICNTRRHFSAISWHPQAFYIPWGTSKDVFGFNEAVVGKNGPVFFHSAGLNPHRKGTDILVKAFSGIKKNTAKIIIHSQSKLNFKDTKLNEYLSNENVQIIEKNVPPPGLYYLGDVYVYPSRLEGIGLSIAEALMSGLPAIVTDFPPMNEFIKGLKCGVVVKPNRITARSDGYYWPQSEIDADELAKAMKYYIENFSRMKEMKSEAREHALKNLDWEKQRDSINQIFSNIKSIKLDRNVKEMCKIFLAEKNVSLSLLGKIILTKLPIPVKLKSLFYSSFIEKKWKKSSL